MSWYRFDEPDAPRPKRRYRCGGYASYTGHCGALDCDRCHPGGWDEEEEEHETLTRKRVTARKARFVGTPREIRPGDRVVVTSGFTYREGGPRTGYLPKRYYRVEKGPAWEN